MKRQSKIEQQPRFSLSISIPWSLAEELTEAANRRGCTRGRLAREALDKGLPMVMGTSVTPEA